MYFFRKKVLQHFMSITFLILFFHHLDLMKIFVSQSFKRRFVMMFRLIRLRCQCHITWKSQRQFVEDLIGCLTVNPARCCRCFKMLLHRQRSIKVFSIISKKCFMIPLSLRIFSVACKKLTMKVIPAHQ